MFQLLYRKPNRGLGITWLNSNPFKLLHMSPDVVSRQWTDFSEFARFVLTDLLLPLHFRCILLYTQIWCLISFYLVHSADQVTFSFVRWQLLLCLEYFFSSPAYFAQPTVRGCLQTQRSSFVETCCTKRWFHQLDLMIYRLKLEQFFIFQSSL